MMRLIFHRRSSIQGKETMTRLKTLETLEGDSPIACCVPLSVSGLTDEEATATATLFKALSDPARVRILNLLLSADGPICVCDMTPITGLAQPTVSHHLRKLMETGLLKREERGTWAYYSVNEDAMARLRQVTDVRKGARWST
jgi:ArsR family transcriptional regulator